MSLWIAAGLLALVALTGGFTKTFIPKEKLEHQEGAAWSAGSAPSLSRPDAQPPAQRRRDAALAGGRRLQSPWGTVDSSASGGRT